VVEGQALRSHSNRFGHWSEQMVLIPARRRQSVVGEDEDGASAFVV